MSVRFLPSQVDETASTTALPYTAAPLALLWSDLVLFLSFISYLPGLVLPLYPWGYGSLGELYPSWRNIVELVLHIWLIIVQVLFLLSIPLCIFYPFAAVLAYIAGFILLNALFCRILNGREPFLTSKVNLDHFPKHDEERWIFLNGVSVGLGFRLAPIVRANSG